MSEVNMPAIVVASFVPVPHAEYHLVVDDPDIRAAAVPGAKLAILVGKLDDEEFVYPMGVTCEVDQAVTLPDGCTNLRLITKEPLAVAGVNAAKNAVSGRATPWNVGKVPAAERDALITLLSAWTPPLRDELRSRLNATQGAEAFLALVAWAACAPKRLSRKPGYQLQHDDLGRAEVERFNVAIAQRVEWLRAGESLAGAMKALLQRESAGL